MSLGVSGFRYALGGKARGAGGTVVCYHGDGGFLHDCAGYHPRESGITVIGVIVTTITALWH